MFEAEAKTEAKILASRPLWPRGLNITAIGQIGAVLDMDRNSLTQPNPTAFCDSTRPIVAQIINLRKCQQTSSKHYAHVRKSKSVLTLSAQQVTKQPVVTSPVDMLHDSQRQELWLLAYSHYYCKVHFWITVLTQSDPPKVKYFAIQPNPTHGRRIRVYLWIVVFNPLTPTVAIWVQL